MTEREKNLLGWCGEQGYLWSIEDYGDDIAKGRDDWETHARLALLYWLSVRDHGLILHHFARAVEKGRYYERVPQDTSQRIPFTFGSWLGIVSAFGSSEQRQRAGMIPQRHWYHPPHPFYAKTADAYALVQAHLRGELTPVLAQPYLEMASRENAGRDVVEFERPWVEGCLAITARDASTWNACIMSMVKYHTFVARYGFLQLSDYGLMCLGGLGLARLGIEAGLKCTVEDLRLPLDLLLGVGDA